MFSKNRFKGEEGGGGEEEELRSLKEVGVNRVYVCRTSLATAWRIMTLDVKLLHLLHTIHPFNHAFNHSRPRSMCSYCLSSRLCPTIPTHAFLGIKLWIRSDTWMISCFQRIDLKGEEGGEEEELRSLKEVGVNRVYVCRTSLATAWRIMTLDVKLLHLLHTIHPFNHAFNPSRPRSMCFLV